MNNLAALNDEAILADKTSLSEIDLDDWKTSAMVYFGQKIIGDTVVDQLEEAVSDFLGGAFDNMPGSEKFVAVYRKIVPMVTGFGAMILKLIIQATVKRLINERMAG